MFHYGLIGVLMSEGKLWCILRTSPGRTLPLAGSLAEAGFVVWTPKQTVTKRRSRSRATYEIEQPLVPTFVFASKDSVVELMSIANAAMSPHPQFSLFQHAGRVPAVSERDIMGMRQEEDRLNLELHRRREAAERTKRIGERKASRRQIPAGASVSIAAGPFAGLTGVVEGGNKKEAFVNLGGGFVVKIDTWLFAEDIVRTKQAHMGNAALAA